MAEIRIEDPEIYDSKTIDSQGRLYIGREYAGKRVKIVVEEVEDDPDAGPPEKAESEQ